MPQLAGELCAPTLRAAALSAFVVEPVGAQRGPLRGGAGVPPHCGHSSGFLHLRATRGPDCQTQHV